MGSTAERNNKKSKAVVADAHGLIEELSLLDAPVIRLKPVDGP